MTLTLALQSSTSAHRTFQISSSSANARHRSHSRRKKSTKSMSKHAPFSNTTAVSKHLAFLTCSLIRPSPSMCCIAAHLQQHLENVFHSSTTLQTILPTSNHCSPYIPVLCQWTKALHHLSHSNRKPTKSMSWCAHVQMISHPPTPNFAAILTLHKTGSVRRCLPAAEPFQRVKKRLCKCWVSVCIVC